MAELIPEMGDYYCKAGDGQNSIALGGSLDVSNVEQAFKDGLALSQGWPEVEISLGGIDNADSSVLALLVEWQNAAAAREQKILFRDTPDFIMAIMKLSELQTILPLTL